MRGSIAQQDEGPARKLFGEAVQRDAAVRREFIHIACGADERLRAEVESLLTAYEGACDLLLEMGPGSAEASEDAGGTIGPYTLVRRLGEGGFGVVYVAEQSRPVRRRVALKIIKVGMDTRQTVARFEVERQALAMMDHPHIAKAFDAGATETGRPYFVMELVDGVPITDYCEGGRLDVPDRLALFAQVCLAVHHAHQKGIIHRDLKPSNVLVAVVDGAPVPKVIDFGVAKATQRPLTDRTAVTDYQQLIGTPEYMSPEQAAMSGDIDTRADIYSLGALLYELLAGTPPFGATGLRGKPFSEVQRVVREVEPPSPSARVAMEAAKAVGSPHAESARLARRLRGELDWIVMKCLEKDRARRYETAGALAADVRGHLAGQPVSAGPPTLRYRLGKFAVRNKPLIAAAATVAITLLAGSALATYGMVHAMRARADEAREHRVADAVSRVLQDMLASVDPDLGKGREVLVRQVLDEAAKKLDDGSLREQPEVEAAIRGTLGRSYVSLGDVGRAEPQLRRTLDLRTRLRGAEHREVAESLFDLGTALQLKRDEDGAMETYRRSLDLFRRTQFPGDSRLPLIHCLTNYGIVLGWHDRFVDAEAMLTEALSLSRAVGADVETAKSIHCLAGISARRGDLGKAVSQFREALALYRKALGEENRQVAITMGQLGTTLANLGQLPEAERLLREQIAMAGRLLGETHPHAVEPQRVLADVVARQGRQEEARRLRDAALTRQIEQLTALIARDPADAVSIRRRAENYAELGRPAEALSDFERALSLQPGARAPLLAARAKALAHLGRFHDALADFNHVLEDNPNDNLAWFYSGCLSAFLGETADYRSRCQEMLRRFSGTTDPYVAERTARACLLSPDAVDPADVMGLVDRALAAKTPESFLPGFRMTKGIAEHRLGHEARAVELLTTGRDGLDPIRSHDGIYAAQAAADFYLAMTRRGMGDAAAAREAMRRGVERTIGRRPPAEDNYYRGDIEHWLIAEIARREAASIVEPPPNGDEK